MSRKARSQHLLEKSVHAALPAIELNNKHYFKYRKASFSILTVNAWELLLKARILQRNKYKVESIYISDRNKIRKDDKPFQKPKYKTSRSGNNLTIDITIPMKVLKLPERWKENLGLLIEIRDYVIHFTNDIKSFEKKFLEIETSFHFQKKNVSTLIRSEYSLSAGLGVRNHRNMH